MSLTEMMSRFGPSQWVEIALCIFIAVYVAVVARALLLRRKDAIALGNLPLEEGGQGLFNEEAKGDSNE